ncbi:hypothetical protein JZ751_029072 [Albula glossodonta]|uniref:Uncharacterized protein n=1 Tax=Albula glossodonta TaxID=121402 RepID=A0A8T2P886_9TELE|nr:hypothetical protein JZ751_029072 [Albula glossodonta]
MPLSALAGLAVAARHRASNQCQHVEMLERNASLRGVRNTHLPTPAWGMVWRLF